MKCNVVSIKCELGEGGYCGISYKNCLGETITISDIPSSSTILLDGNQHPCVDSDEEIEIILLLVIWILCLKIVNYLIKQ